MAWIRVDDGLAEHRKLLKLKRTDRWTWMEVLCYVARQNNGGHVPRAVGDIVRHATPKFLERAHEIGLLDVQDEDTFVVHDWAIYNGNTIATRVAAYLVDHPDASANDVAKHVGGNRKLVLAEVETQRKAGT